MDKKQKYQLNELLAIRSLGMDLVVRVTKRRIECDYDTGEGVFYYDFIHAANIEKPWHWEKVDEESLDDMIWEAKRFKLK